jgi:hypothetical protein
MNALKVICIAVLLLAASPANAGWQYTRWGMTPAQVLTASNNTLRPPTPDEQRGQTVVGLAPSLTGRFDNRSFQFNSYFYFGAPGSGLSEVRLTLLDYQKLPSLLGVIQSSYGQPVEQDPGAISGRGGTSRWRDEKNQNEMRLFLMPEISHAQMIYGPLPSARGL